MNRVRWGVLVYEPADGTASWEPGAESEQATLKPAEAALVGPYDDKVEAEMAVERLDARAGGSVEAVVIPMYTRGTAVHLAGVDRILEAVGYQVPS